MGCGKSSVGREIASRLGCPFTDLDEFIEKQQGRTVASIFSTEGEAGFRAIELEALMEVISSYDGGTMYLSLGGGTLTTPAARTIIASSTRCIYLRASVDTLVENLTLTGLTTRPLLSGISSSQRPAVSSSPGGHTALSAVDKAALRRRVEALLSERSDLYEETADVIIDIDSLTTAEIASVVCGG